jgi:hypothetical protein
VDLELLIRTSGFAVVFAAMALWQVAALRRLLAVGRGTALGGAGALAGTTRALTLASASALLPLSRVRGAAP